MSWLWLLGGALLAWMSTDGFGDRGFGFVVMALAVGVLLQRQQRRIEQLEAALHAGAAPAPVEAEVVAPSFDAPFEVAPIEKVPSEVAPVEVAPVEVAPLEVAPIEVAPIEVGPIEEAAPDPAPLTAPALRAEAPPALDERALHVTTSVARSLLAWFRGGNTIVRLGTVILFLGVAFLLRFAAEHASLPVELRLAGVALGGAVLVGLGWRLTRKRPGYGISLQGAGFGVLYLVVFAALRLYGLLPAGLAMALLAALSLLTAVFAMAQNALALAVLGFGGGFLAPVLASTGSGSHIALFSYQLLLNLGIAWVASRKAWKLLNLVGFTFTFVIGAAWGWRSYEPSLYASTQLFLLLHFALYLYICVQYSRQLMAAAATQDAAAPPLPVVDGSLLFGLPIVAFGLQAALMKPWPYGLAVSAAVLSAVYLLLGRWLWRHAGSQLRLLTEGLLALGLVFLVLVTPLALDARWTGAAWGVQGAGLLWVALRQQRGWAALSGLLLQVCAALSFWNAPRLVNAPLFAHADMLGALLLGGSALVSARLLLRAAGQARSWPGAAEPLPVDLLQTLHWLALAAGLAQLLGGLWLDLWRLDAPAFDHDLRAVLLFALAAAALERWHARWAELSLPARGLSALALAVSGVAVLDALLDGPSAAYTRFAWHFGWLEALAAGGAALWLLRRLDRAPGPWRQSLGVEHLLLGWYALWQGGAQAYAAAGVAITRHQAWTPLAAIVLPSLLAWWLCGRARDGRWPVAAHPRAWSLGLLRPWLGLLALWCLSTDALLDGGMDPLPYVPLLNPVDLGHGLALLLAVRMWRQGLLATRWLGPVVAVLGWWWLSAVLVRSLHHWAGTPMWGHGVLYSSAAQAGLTLLWTVLALLAMLYATRRAPAARARNVWLCGAALLALVVGKLFFIDLSGIGTLERIVSFLGVGVLMLVIGYVSPMPPAAARTTA